MSKQEWGEVSERLEALALKLKLHLRQARGEPAAGTNAPAVPEPSGEAKTEGVAEALETVRRGIEEAFDAAGNAIKDEAVRADFRDLGRLLSGAFSTTWSKATEDIREFVTRR